SGHAIPDALHCLRNGLPNRGAYLFELRPQRLGLRGNVLVNRFWNALFHTSFYVSTCGFSSPLSIKPSSFSGDPFHTVSVWGTQLGRGVPFAEKCRRNSVGLLLAYD